MTTEIQRFTPLNPLDRVGPPTLANRIRTTAHAVFREVTEAIKAALDLRNELRRMADEFESTRPEQAARLRKLANSNWGD